MDRYRIKRFLKKVFVFLTVFFAVSSVILIDARASGIIGNTGIFSSSFTRKNEREVEVKIMGFEICLKNGIAVEKKAS